MSDLIEYYDSKGNYLAHDLDEDFKFKATGSFRYFSDSGDPGFNGISNMNHGLMLMLDEFRHQLKHPLYINSGFRPNGRKKSKHYRGLAVDIVCPSMKLKDFHHAALKFQHYDLYYLKEYGYPYKSFDGIGLYPFWNTPGLHLDLQRSPLKWYRDSTKKYIYPYTLSEIDDYARGFGQLNFEIDKWEELDLCNHDH